MEMPREAGAHGTATKFSLPITSSRSPCSTPSPEFSFTISFDSPSTTATRTVIKPSFSSRCYKSLPPSAGAMAPADDLFFHGQLLPLQHFSRPPPVAPGGSLYAIDATTTRCLRQDSSSTAAGDTNSVGGGSSSFGSCSNTSSSGESKERAAKSRTTSLLRGLGKWWRGNEEAKERNSDGKKIKMKVFDVMGRTLRRYMSAVEPLFSFRSGRDRCGALRQRPYSFSGNTTNSMVVRREEWRRPRRRGEYSAPASMRASPTNSGILLRAAKSGSSDASTMEELQSAVQAAIAHCKNSVASREDKCIL